MKQTVVSIALLLAAASAFAAAPVKHKKKIHAALLTRKQAYAALAAQVKGAKILEAELERESGRLIWSFDVEANNGITEIWLDPHTGALIKSQVESARKEAQERRQEMKQRAAAKKDEQAEIKKDVKEDRKAPAGH
ncbi:MAG: PepSY domain-containing protein [Elusimicrobia bacterium]|nr:PepSY domain-containing protein [Elusimicrobiota bacterium]